jgi:hypothetical protein
VTLFEDAEFAPPFRVLLLGAPSQGYYAADDDARSEAIDDLAVAFRELVRDGARLVGSIDDDLFLTGQPGSLPFSFFVLYDVDDPAVVVRFLNRIRTGRLSRAFRFEARVGRKLFLLDA